MRVPEKEVEGLEEILKKVKKWNSRGTRGSNLWVETISDGKQEPRVEKWTREADKPYGGHAAFGFHVHNGVHKDGVCGGAWRQSSLCYGLLVGLYVARRKEPDLILTRENGNGQWWHTGEDSGGQ